MDGVPDPGIPTQEMGPLTLEEFRGDEGTTEESIVVETKEKVPTV